MSIPPFRESTKRGKLLSKKREEREKVWNAVRSDADEEKDRFDAAIISQTPIT